MTHDSDYFRRRAAEERAAAFRKDADEDVEVAGQLALAYSALARKRTMPPSDSPAIPLIEE
ncbi:hypothetical protein G7078_02990 [Sphingomonas sinipercae]|uniref:Uncharacterized protein n=1 Tax=Sphingomonas sinipercae TaxID=2714944 RepID=A0A6G7ZLN9_9SPHN|nr:hypothetical protein [Sphingomonas sinipercae]QIL01853.1 hypothetical protein G7078_02990 [Sphingomonas sinipercae]